MNTEIKGRHNIAAVLLIAFIAVLAVSMIFCIAKTDVSSAEGESAAVWDGTADTSWYSDAETEFVLTTPEQLAGFASLVTNRTTFEGKTVKLGADMNLNGRRNGDTEWILTGADPSAEGYSESAVTVNSNLIWQPIGGVYQENCPEFWGTFDGQGHTVSNMCAVSDEKGVGFFGMIYGGTGFTVKNVVFDDCFAMSRNTNEGNVAIVMGYAAYYMEDSIPSFENVTVKNSVVRGSNTAGIMAGFYKSVNAKNCLIENCTVNANVGGDAQWIGVFAGKMYDTHSLATFYNNRIVNSRIITNGAASISNYGLWGGLNDPFTMLYCYSDSEEAVTSNTDYLTNIGYGAGIASFIVDGEDKTESLTVSEKGFLYCTEADSTSVQLGFYNAPTVTSFKLNGADYTGYVVSEDGKTITVNGLTNPSDAITVRLDFSGVITEVNVVTGFVAMPDVVRTVGDLSLGEGSDFIALNDGVYYYVSDEFSHLKLGFQSALDANAAAVVEYNGASVEITGSEVADLGAVSAKDKIVLKYYYMDIPVSVTEFSDLAGLKYLSEGIYYLDGGEYPWERVSSSDTGNALGFDYLKSSESVKGVANSNSVLTLYVKGYSGLYFEYASSSESNYDYLIAEYTDKKIEYKGIDTVSDISALVWNNDTLRFTDGVFNEVTFTYKKDVSGDKGLDQAFLRNLTVLEKFDFSSAGSAKIRTTLNGVVSENDLANGEIIDFMISDEFSATVLVPVLSQGERCYVMIDGVKNDAPLTADTGYYVYIIPSFSANKEVKFTYEREGFLTEEFVVSFNMTVSGTMQDNLIGTGNVTVDNTVYEYPFAYVASLSSKDRIAYGSTNREVDGSYSGFTFTVSESGVLKFEYYISSESNYDIVYYNLNGTKITDDNRASQSFLTGDKSTSSGEQGWNTAEIPVSVNDGETLELHFVYYKDGSNYSGDDVFAIANVEYNVGIFNVSYDVSNVEAGVVSAEKSDGSAVESGSPVGAGTRIILKASVNDGCRFYAWKNNDTGALIFTATVEISIVSDLNYTAIIEPAGTYILRGESGFYPDFATAFAGTDATLYAVDDFVISDNVTVPAGKKLIIPYSSNDTTGYAEGGAYDRVSWNLSVEPYVTVTIANGATLTIEGRIVVGGVQHRANQTAQGHTSGAYSKLVNNGTLVISDGGYADVIGLVSGSGTLNVNAGATLRQPFMVNNYSGGTNTENLYDNSQFPFVQFATVNVTCNQTVLYGAKVIGSTSLFFWGSITTQDVVLVDKIENKGSEGSLIWMQEGSRLEISYDGAKCVNQTVGNIHLGDSGVTTIDVFGNVTAGEFSLQGYGSENMVLAIPYTYNFNISDGAVVTVSHKYKIMPGAVVTVNAGGAIDIGQDGALYVYDGLIQADKSGKYYPDATILGNYGFAKSGMFIVNGTLDVNGIFAGIVQTTSENAVITVGASATVGSMQITDGCEGGYTDNKTVFTTSARVYGINGFINLEAGKTYKGFAQKEFTLGTFTVDSASRISDLTVTLNQRMSGRFLEWNGTRYVADIECYVGEDADNVKVNVAGVDYITTEGKFTATVNIDDKNALITYSNEKYAPAATFTIELDNVCTLNRVFKSATLKETNVYLRVYDKDGNITDDFALAATVAFYGGESVEVVLAPPSSLGEFYVTKDASLTAEDLTDALTHNLYVAGSEVAAYINDTENLSLSEDISSAAKSLYERYLELIAKGGEEDVTFITDYLKTYVGYQSTVVGSVMKSGEIVYGDNTANVTVTFVNGDTANATGTLSSWNINNGEIEVTLTYTGTFESNDYCVEARVTALKKELTLTLDCALSAGYNGYEQTFGATLTGVLSADADGVAVVPFRAKDVCKEEHTFTLTGEKAGFYNLVGDNLTYTFEITAKAIEAAIRSATSVYGADIAGLSYTLEADALEGSDTDDFIVLSTSAVKGNGVGRYDITGISNNGNYIVTFKGGEDAYEITPFAVDIETQPVSAVVEGFETIYISDTVSQTTPDIDFTSTLTHEIYKDGTLVATVARNGAVTTLSGAPLLAGEYKVKAVNNDANYTVSSQNTVSLEVVVTEYVVDFGIEGDSKIYDGSVLTVSPVVKVGSTQEVISAFTLKITKNGEISEIKEAGDYIITVTVKEEGKSEVTYSKNYRVNAKTLSVAITEIVRTYGDTLNIFDWRSMISGYLDGTDDNTFRATFYKADNPSEYFNEITDAGEYIMRIEILNLSYAFENGNVATVDVVVEKKDLSDYISITGAEDGKYVVLKADIEINAGLSGGYAAEIIGELRKDGTVVSDVDSVGNYSFTAVVNDANYKGEKSITFRAVRDASDKIAALKAYAEKEPFSKEDYENLKELVDGIDSDDMLQINDNAEAKENLEKAEKIVGVYTDTVILLESLLKEYNEGAYDKIEDMHTLLTALDETELSIVRKTTAGKNYETIRAELTSEKEKASAVAGKISDKILFNLIIAAGVGAVALYLAIRRLSF